MLQGRRVLTAVVALGVVLSLARAAEAGPPLICHPFDAGNAPLLPWARGQGWNTPDRSYDVQRLTADTMRLLTPDAPVLARMENLRRATIYAAQDRRVAAELLSAVLGQALTAAASGSRDALPWFDAGYLIESYRQASAIYKWDMLSASRKDVLDHPKRAAESRRLPLRPEGDRTVPIERRDGVRRFADERRRSLCRASSPGCGRSDGRVAPGEKPLALGRALVRLLWRDVEVGCEASNSSGAGRYTDRPRGFRPACFARQRTDCVAHGLTATPSSAGSCRSESTDRSSRCSTATPSPSSSGR